MTTAVIYCKRETVDLNNLSLEKDPLLKPLTLKLVDNTAVWTRVAAVCTEMTVRQSLNYSVSKRTVLLISIQFQGGGRLYQIAVSITVSICTSETASLFKI